MTDSKQKCIMIDIDGVMTAIEIKRSKPVPPSLYQKFYDRIPKDKVNEWAIELIKAMMAQGYVVIFCTGRHERVRKDTEDWILKKCELSPKDYILLMRAENDGRKDFRVKRDIYRRQIKSKYNVLFILEDRKSVVKMWRNLKLVVLQNTWGLY